MTSLLAYISDKVIA